ncbi:hypothetical protein [Corynebacterium sp. HMSC28B08]|uniref:hypothetical protein n=1 Tax=Corynebacterium TaxID=1716 RepID=UPI0008A18E81|nr:hypothetical protein [Corynebacterium sp. HMSC28B08]
MTRFEVRKLDKLRDDNQQLKALLGQAELEQAALRELAEGKTLSPARRHEAVDYLISQGYVQRLSCRVVGLSRSAYN